MKPSIEELKTSWESLVESYLPHQIDSYWRSSGAWASDGPSQGWKLHVSATILQACDLFATVAPLLREANVLIKAPPSLDELQKLNSGIIYGYEQVGKFITVYPPDDAEAVRLAGCLHELTQGFISITVPFDRRYALDSNVFYRYGSFANTELDYGNGKRVPALFNDAGVPIADDRRKPVPDWVRDPFPTAKEKSTGKSFAGTPLAEKYRIFSALSQRGKGGTFAAVDLREAKPRLCLVKEGRRHGEVDWDGRDGYDLLARECRVLEEMQHKVECVPRVFDSFDVNDNRYLVMERLEGRSLQQLLAKRRRRFSIKQIVRFGIEIAKAIRMIHAGGWVWSDCKPANLIVAPSGGIRPVDFEAAYKIGHPEPFVWRTAGFAAPDEVSAGPANDIYSFGAVIYFLLTAKMYDANKPVPIKDFRRRVPRPLIATTMSLLEGSETDLKNVHRRLENLLTTLN